MILIELVGGPHDGYRMEVRMDTVLIQMPRPVSDEVMVMDVYEPRKCCRGGAWLFDYKPNVVVV